MIDQSDPQPLIRRWLLKTADKLLELGFNPFLVGIEEELLEETYGGLWDWAVSNLGRTKSRFWWLGETGWLKSLLPRIISHCCGPDLTRLDEININQEGLSVSPDSPLLWWTDAPAGSPVPASLRILNGGGFSRSQIASLLAGLVNLETVNRVFLPRSLALENYQQSEKFIIEKPAEINRTTPAILWVWGCSPANQLRVLDHLSKTPVVVPATDCWKQLLKGHDERLFYQDERPAFGLEIIDRLLKKAVQLDELLIRQQTINSGCAAEVASYLKEKFC